MCFREKLPEDQIVNSSVVLNTLKKLKKCEYMNVYVCILNKVCYYGIVSNLVLFQSKHSCMCFSSDRKCEC